MSEVFAYTAPCQDLTVPEAGQIRPTLQTLTSSDFIATTKEQREFDRGVSAVRLGTLSNDVTTSE